MKIKFFLPIVHSLLLVSIGGFARSHVIGQDRVPATVAEYIDAVGQIRTLEFTMESWSPERQQKCKVPSWIPRKNGLCMLQKAVVRMDLVNHNYYAKLFDCTSDGLGEMISEFSYFDLRVTSYLDAKSPMFVRVPDSEPPLSPANGYIGPESSASRQYAYGPEMPLGFRYAHQWRFGEDGLADLLANCPRFEVNPEGTIIARDLFNKNLPNVRIDVEMKFDGSLLKEFTTYTVQPDRGTKTIFSEWKVQRFHEVDGFRIPVRYSYRLFGIDVYYEVDPASIRVNRTLNADDFSVRIPAGQAYTDGDSNKLMRDGKEVVDKAAEPKRFPIGMMLIGFVFLIVVVRLAVRAKARFLILAICVPIIGGCSDRREPTETYLDIAGLIAVSPREIEVSSEVGVSTGFRFKLRNISEDSLEFDPNLITTCGCTNASLSQTKMAPGEEIELTGRIHETDIPGIRIIGVRLSVIAPHPAVSELVVTHNAVGDWLVSSGVHRGKNIELEGIYGEFGKAELVLRSAIPAILGGISVESDAFEIFEDFERSVSQTRRFHLITPTPLATDARLAGNVLIKSELGVPHELTLNASANGRPAGKWIPSLAVSLIGVEKEAILRIEPGCELLGVSPLPAESVSVLATESLNEGQVKLKFKLNDSSDSRLDAKLLLPNGAETSVALPIRFVTPD